jgi:ribonuclease R
VRLKEYFVEGCVHVSRLIDDYYSLDENEATLVGHESGRTFRLGRQIEVVLASCDQELRKIDFIPADGETLPPGKTSREKRKESRGEYARGKENRKRG